MRSGQEVEQLGVGIQTINHEVKGLVQRSYAEDNRHQSCNNTHFMQDMSLSNTHKTIHVLQLSHFFVFLFKMQ